MGVAAGVGALSGISVPEQDQTQTVADESKNVHHLNHQKFATKGRVLALAFFAKDLSKRWKKLNQLFIRERKYMQVSSGAFGGEACCCLVTSESFSMSWLFTLAT